MFLSKTFPKDSVGLMSHYSQETLGISSTIMFISFFFVCVG